ncbi:ABC transporter substrate-binding protein [Rhodococcus sp. SGAir0479]|uniref:ABC transporter substrate-binding protein n=1 Tax=Rhodococcus sp. SGAir0479 TaxID=2567884 RepID=UPI0010CD53FB|nr:ABC transporter substrate-binding protein [Rhodococcus sp. SGAir0479]QCQ92743.1 ABC transporter substrate-binding protein [Rhodococcus sp. SGAir0479]
MSKYSRRVSRMLAMVAIGAVALTGCANAEGDSQDDSSGATTTAYGILGDQGDGGTPVSGGTLSFASYAPVTSLDPTVTQPAGATGGTEMAAVYDVLMRYDTGSRTFEPQLAKSFEESPDFLTWTLKLRDGVTFSDGSPLDANAVVASINRYNQRRGANSQVYTQMVKSTEARDASTVVFTLNQPWRTFPAMLAYGHGMIVAPSSQQGDKFTPIGAGPYTVVNLQPQQELQLKARPDYWGGAPNLEGLKFVAIAGEQPKIDALKTNGIDAIYLRNAETVNAAKAEFPGYIETTSMSMVGQLNGAPGRPAADPRVRQAIAFAVDPEVLNQRVRAGEGMPGSDMFQPWSEWFGGTEGISPDAAKAKELLDQAKADGYNGKLTYVGVNDPDAQQLALAVQAQLNSIGFDVSLETTSSITDMVKRLYIDRNYDMSYGAYSIADVAPEIRLFSSLSSTSTNNILGYKSPEMDALLAKVLSAPDETAKRDAIVEIQKLVNNDQPFLSWGAGVNYIAWSDKVYRANPTVDGIILFDKAFKKN